MDNNIITIFSVIAGIGTFATAVIAVAALWFEQRRSNLSLSADLALRLDDRYYHSKGMKEKRKEAAKAILNKKGNKLDDILDFFELIAVLTNRGALDKEIAWNTFYNPIMNYWLAGKDYIANAIEEDSAVWKDLRTLVDTLQDVEKKKKNGEIKIPSKEKIREFLNEESNL
jgi:hypothetical protein